MIDWKEVSRDIMALGGLPFYFIVIVRAIVGESYSFIMQLVIAFAISFALSKIVKSNQHVARGFILLFFISLFYKEIIFTVGAAILWIGMIFSLRNLKIKNEEIIKGVVFGIISAAISYYLTPLLI